MKHEDLEADARKIRIWKVRTTGGSAQKDLERVVKEASGMNAEVAVFDADMVFGPDHVRTAFYHAKKALSEGRNAASSLAMEMILYASGERQLASALRKMAVGEGTTGLVVAALPGTPFPPMPGWEPMEEDFIQTDRRKYVRFGLTDEELGTVHEERWSELVLERVASVDVLKK